MSDGHKRTVNDAPVVDLKLPPVIFERYFFQSAVEHRSYNIHPGVKPAKACDNLIGDILHVLEAGRVSRDVDRLISLGLQLLLKLF